VLVGVVGGKLQGVEAAYLARKAGWEARIVDVEPRVPASVLGGSFLQVDVTREEDLGKALGDVDLVIPALEDAAALASLTRWSREADIPLAFDADAYAISSSKLRSARFFDEIGSPVPTAWPECGFPVLAKPDQGSGSKGVRVFRDLDALKSDFPSGPPASGWVLEEYLEGSQHSLEIVGRPGSYRALQVTDLYVDDDYDCKRVIAPSNLPPELVAEFEKSSLAIAEALELNGVMDVEAILSREELKILEIDARLPSQTPTAVYWSTGQNMVGLLGEIYAAPTGAAPPARAEARGAVYEHIHLSGDRLKVCGERIMVEHGPLELVTDFFGADEAITNFETGCDSWVATLIFGASGRREACEKRNRCLGEIVRHFETRDDPAPIR
jgi:pyrrolysine biosynthesis protein PylC